MKFLLPIIALISTLSACSHIEPNPIQEYLQLAPSDTDLTQYPRLQPFIKLYDNLDHGDLKTLVGDAYADKLYFNDTVVTLHDQPSLLLYLLRTQGHLDDISCEILSILEQNQNSFVRWRMRTQFTILGQQKMVETIGISHLRFNPQGKIVLHQDYWDSMQGFYLHIPVIGGVLQWLKNDLQD